MLKCVETNPKSMTKDERDNVYRKLLFSTGFFYALLVERRKFGTLGFNIRYSFSQADFETAIEILKCYIRRYDKIPWQALRYVIAQIVFGGRLIDDLDRRILWCYINDLFNDDVITEPQYMLSQQSEMYYVPQRSPLAEYREYIKQLPTTDIANVFG
jgi:dynein heavy chain